MTKLYAAVFTLGLTMCHYAPAQTTQIITPDGKIITCINSNNTVVCF
jgi:hypothetical protein